MNIRFIPMVPEVDWPLVNDKIGTRWVEDTKGILAIDDKSGECVAGCILNNWTYSSVCVHQWIDNPLVLRHGFFEEICRYVFEVAGREVLIGLVPADNEKALKLNKHIGFKETHRVKDGFRRGVDTVIMEARYEDLYRWMPKRMVANG